MNEKKKDTVHKHFANDDPTKFEHEKMEKLAKEALKKFKSLQYYLASICCSTSSKNSWCYG